MYNSFSELIGITRERHIPIWKAVIEEEKELTGASEEKIYEVFSKRFKIMEQSAKKALGAPQPTVANLVSGFSAQQWSYAENGRTICLYVKDLRGAHCWVLRNTSSGADFAER